MVEPTKLVHWYERGAMTRHELVGRICQEAAERAPESIAVELPTDLLAEVRELSITPPHSPDQCRVFTSVCSTGEYDWDRHFREESLRLYNGHWRWHHYFAQAERGTVPNALSE